MKTRLQRFLADCGVASRRQCEQMILSGRVTVNGQVRIDMPVLIDPEKDIIAVDHENVGTQAQGLHEQKKVYFLLNKPKGILVTNNDPSNRKTVNELMAGIKERVFPVGRLDMDSRGALIMTNDGELANRLTHPRYGIEKIYIVEVDGRLGHDDLEKIKRGMWLGPERPGSAGGAVKTDRFRIKVVGRERGRSILEVHVGEAKNSEIRRVMARLGHPVRDLNRVAIGGKLTTKGLDVGDFRALTDAEVKWLFHASSAEYHTQQKSATQSWYEQKEMEKERKRLDREAEESRPVAPRGNAGQHGSAAATSTEKPARQPGTPGVPQKSRHEEKEFRPRPERKGKKPFVPKTGRNAGKPLGGNFLGKQRLERELSNQETEVPPHEDAETIHAEVRAVHPLGDAAKSDE